MSTLYGSFFFQTVRLMSCCKNTLAKHISELVYMAQAFLEVITSSKFFLAFHHHRSIYATISCRALFGLWSNVLSVCFILDRNGGTHSWTALYFHQGSRRSGIVIKRHCCKGWSRRNSLHWHGELLVCVSKLSFLCSSLWAWMESAIKVFPSMGWTKKIEERSIW